jgi:polyether ionophore transport system permease protein
MSADAALAPRAISPPSPLSRIYGFGSIYAKTIRDSRLAFIIAAGLLGGLALFMGAAISNVFPTPASRLGVNALIGSMPPDLVNLFGKPVKLGTLGGYMSWKYGATFALGAALWSIFALSGTLAGEAGRGSLDIVAAVPFGRRRIALEKLAAHLTMLALAVTVVAVCTTVSSNVFGDAALGDQIPPLSAFGFALWVGGLAACFGGLAWVLGPVLGRAGAAGLASAVMFILWIANGFTALDSIAVLSPFRWTADHIALVGRYDWGGLALVGAVALVLLAAGVEVFTRRDLGVTVGWSLPGLPQWILGVRGPISRALGEQLPRALWWGLGMGLIGAMLVSLVGSFAAQIAQDPNLQKTFSVIFPGSNTTTAGGWLEVFAQLLYIGAGFAGVTFVSKWAGDENAGRLELLLATPMTRARWVITGGIAALLAVVVLNVLLELGIVIGAAAGGVAIGDALVGSVALGLFAAAMVGIGVAVGGLWRTSLAAELAAVVVVATYLIDLLAPPLKLPDWVHQLALIAHYGHPMVGTWDTTGVIASAVLAVGGVLLGAWGMIRRDVVA